MAATDAKHHDYHLVNPSPWPVIASIAAFVMMVGAVIWMRSMSEGAGVFGITGPGCSPSALPVSLPAPSSGGAT